MINLFEKNQRVKNVKHLILMNIQNNVFDSPVIPKEYNLFSPNNESSLEQ